MKRYGITSIAAMAAILGLAACAPATMSLTNHTPESLIIGGKEADHYLSKKIELRKSLNALRGKGFVSDQGPKKIGILVNLVRQENAKSPLRALNGLGGVYGRALLNAASLTVNQNDEYDPAKTVTISTSGQILYYSFDSGALSGTLKVETRVVVKVDNIVIDDDTWFWSIEVLPNGYTVIPKDINDPNLFGAPNTLVFTQEMKNKIATLNLNYKLWAKGTKIRIKEVKRNGVLLGQSTGLYMPDQESCIDLLSQNPPPPADIAAFGAYCLGRCANPPIINTK